MCDNCIKEYVQSHYVDGGNTGNSGYIGANGYTGRVLHCGNCRLRTRYTMGSSLPNLYKSIMDYFYPQSHSVRVEDDIKTNKEGLQCSICYENQKCILLNPCKHCCMCATCFKNINVNEREGIICPICNSFIHSIEKIYLS